MHTSIAITNRCEVTTRDLSLGGSEKETPPNGVTDAPHAVDSLSDRLEALPETAPSDILDRAGAPDRH